MQSIKQSPHTEVNKGHLVHLHINQSADVFLGLHGQRDGVAA